MVISKAPGDFGFGFLLREVMANRLFERYNLIMSCNLAKCIVVRKKAKDEKMEEFTAKLVRGKAARRKAHL